jgi:transposase InsO family protein
LFRGLAAARRIIEEWRNDYNEHRPHTSLRGLTGPVAKGVEIRGGVISG